MSLLLLAFGAGPGCRVVQTAVDVPGQTVRAVTPGGKAKQKAVNPVEVQETLLRFSDEFSMRMVLAVERLRRDSAAMSPTDALRWKIALASETCSVASGPNALANLLDMTVLVTLTRMAVENHWQPKVFGDTGLPLLETCRGAEREIWQLAGTILSPAQKVELRGAVEQWDLRNSQPESVLAARAIAFASPVSQTKTEGAAKPGSVFSLLGVDPLAGMDPAVREIAQTRMFAERALYVTQKMPMLLRWQTELLSLNALEMPAVQQLVSNSSQITASVDRFAGVAEKLPGQLSAEREEILKGLEGQAKNLTPLVNEVRQTLSAGTQMSAALNTTLTTFDTVMKRFGVGETNAAGPPPTNAEPFRIQDYTQTAAQLEATASQLTELLLTLDRTIGSTNLAKLSAQAEPVIQQAQVGGKEIVNYAFKKGILFVGTVLVAALIYRFLATRLTPAIRSKTGSP